MSARYWQGVDLILLNDCRASLAAGWLEDKRLRRSYRYRLLHALQGQGERFFELQVDGQQNIVDRRNREPVTLRLKVIGAGLQSVKAILAIVLAHRLASSAGVKIPRGHGDTRQRRPLHVCDCADNERASRLRGSGCGSRSNP